jgi:heavy metal sensor kinase
VIVVTFRSVRLRLTLWYVLLLAVILASFSAGVYVVLRNTLYNNLDDSVEKNATALLDTIQYENGQPTLHLSVSSGNQDGGEHFVRVFDASGSVTFDNSGEAGNVSVDRQSIDRALAGESRMRGVKVDGDQMRVGTWPIERDGQVTGVLEVGASAGDVSHTLGSLVLIMGVAYAATLAMASFGGVFLARRALSPIDKLTRLARRISAEDLGQRLNLRLPDDEVGRLAQTFDEMIARLDDSFRRQRQFTADASHEIRTPLTIMKGQIDVALQKERQPEAYRQVLHAVNEEVDHLIRLAGSLLTLARADAGQIPLAFESLSLADIVAGAMEQVAPIASQRGVDLHLAASPTVILQADEDLMLQLLLNLLDNAIKYTPAGGQITVGWSPDRSQVELWVRDTGVGISEEHLPHIFDRFYRVDKARSRAEGGAGLGLAISRWIAEAHGGSISVESAPGKGSTFTVRMPIQR